MNLDKKVSIERIGSAQDSTGQLVETWTETSTPWASIRPISGREYFNASGEKAEVTHEIVLRHGVTVAPRDRVVYSTRTFNIRSVLNLEERDRYLKLMCVEHVA
jgi:SPP1 family predicted phage head-tail adaptor